ncbi:MAG: sigma-70 family RNA polymerase sigma factor [Nannocystaceae bacterium]
MASDAELFLAWQAGDRRAGGELVDRYVEAVRRFFHNKVDSGIEDLVQQTFLSCVERRDQIRDPEAFRGYLFAAARSKLYDHIRTRCGRNQAPIDPATTSIADAGLSPGSVLAARDEQRLLLLALQHLPTELQIALELYYFERVRGRDLAIALGLPDGTVRSRLRRGLEQLRERLDALTRAESPALRTASSDHLRAWEQGLERDEP